MSIYYNRPTSRNYDVQQETGYPVSTVPEGHWVRGQLIHGPTPVVQPDKRFLFMYDPTDVESWKHAGV